MRIVFLLWALAGCIGSDSVKCGDVMCPAGTVCGSFGDKPICLTREQSTKCEAQPDGARCIADSNDAICQQELCLPGCGDGNVDLGEECDDGNFTSHDECSSSCLTEYAGWRQWKSSWQGRGSHAAGYHPAMQQLVVIGGGTTLGSYADQWTRGVTGEWKRTMPSLAARQGAAMAYDSARGRLVMFGGRAGSNVLDGHFEYDGTNWIEKTMQPKPPPRYGAAMVFDPVRNRIVLFGGAAATLRGDTWEYDGATWTQATPAQAPAARLWPAMAWDTTRSRAVLFGGYVGGERFDTWEYANQEWTPIVVTARPQARHGAGMAYLPSRGKVVLFGGAITLFDRVNDTWEYDGTWTQIALPLSPPAREHMTLTYDANAQGLVMVMGFDNAQAPLGDVWLYGATGRWSDITPVFSPSARITEMIHDAGRKELLLVNGCSEGSVSVAGTWRFGRDSNADFNWSLAAASDQDSFKRCYHALVYDSTRKATIRYGGATSGAVANRDDTWLWDGATWNVVIGADQPTSPPDRIDAAFADNPREQTLLMFGGVLANAQSTNETWQLQGSTWTKLSTPSDLEAQASSSMAYDPIGERHVLFSADGTTWQFRDATWTKLVLDDAPVRRRMARVVWDPWRQRIVLFGGTGTTTGIDFADLWELRETRWDKVRLIGAQPATRLRPAFAAYPELRGLVMFGGATFDDTWVLQFISDTALEHCNNQMDDDGDLQIDSADPDCTLFD